MAPPQPTEPNARHKDLIKDLLKTISMVKHAKLSPWERLACASQLVGQLIPMQDTAAHSPEDIQLLVEGNITGGREHVIALIASIGKDIQL